MTALPVATVDTNLLASGAPSAHPDAAPARLLAAWRAGQFRLVLSEHILQELAETFAKSYFAHRLSLDRRQAFMHLLRTEATVTPLSVTVTGVASHPEDDLVVATALSGGAQFLVTGDHQLLQRKVYQDLFIVGAQDFLAMLPGLLPR